MNDSPNIPHGCERCGRLQASLNAYAADVVAIERDAIAYRGLLLLTLEMVGQVGAERDRARELNVKLREELRQLRDQVISANNLESRAA